MKLSARIASAIGAEKQIIIAINIEILTDTTEND
jgi:hypothetical protein